MSSTARRISPRLAVGLVCIVTTTACRHESRPTHLIDGTAAQAAPVVLEGVAAPTVMTVVRFAGMSLSCDLGGPAGDVAVRRVGVSGSSVTASSRDEHAVRACDSTGGETWCGRAFAPLRPDRRVDARLSLTCHQNGRPLGFAWIQPGQNAAYVVVQHRGYAEVYAATATAPVRVTTADVDISTSSAQLDVSEHTTNGRRLREYMLRPHVSG